MTNTNGYPNTDNYERLRRSAKDLIDHGVPPPSRGGNLNAEALHLLYERAKSPDSAADALKLLHELQTYQVELDLLYEQLQANEQEISEELAHYRSLYEQAPAVYLVIAKDGEIIEGNEAAGVLFGEPHQTLTGKALSELLASGQESAVTRLIRDSLEQAEGPQNVAEGSLELPDGSRIDARAKSSATGDSVLMILAGASTPSSTHATTDSARF